MLKKIETFMRKIENREPIIGTSTTFHDPSITEILADDGYDFIWIDGEHTSLAPKDIMLQIMATRGTEAAAFVRVPWNDPVLVKPILEFDPDGIIFPLVKTAEEAREAVAACTYPPQGIRGFGPRRANRYGLVEGREYVESAYSQFWTIIQIEHVEAVNNLEAILQVEGVDAILVGPNDLAGSIGLLGETQHPEVEKLMDTIGTIAKESGKPFGAVVGNNERVAAKWLERGAHMIRVGTDVALLQRGALEVLDSMQRVFDKRP